MQMYGFSQTAASGVWELSLMTDVGMGNGTPLMTPQGPMPTRWKTETVKTGKKKAIIDECSRLNREISEARKAAVANG